MRVLVLGAGVVGTATAWYAACAGHQVSAQIVRMSIYSRESLMELREETRIAYDHLARGILQFFTERDAFERARESTRIMRSYGLDVALKSREEALALEPALAPAAGRLVGATYSPTDESGDAHLFTCGLARLAGAKGVKFLFGRTVTGVRVAGDGVAGVVVRSGEDEETLTADAYVLSLGSYSPLLTRPIGLDLPIYPLKGYSASIEIAEEARAPTVSLTDDEAKLVFSRLGSRLRVAGTAELAGYDTELNAVRCEALVSRAREFFPGAAHYDRAVFWTGLRPATPSNVPLVGATRIPRLYLNTGHGTLGWTMACGSGRALADILSGRKPQVDFAFTS